MERWAWTTSTCVQCGREFEGRTSHNRLYCSQECRQPADPEVRFWRRVERQSDGCWLWTGWINNKGYGTLSVQGAPTYAHRWAYERWVAPIPEGLVIDHLCRNPACCNPAHLEAVTQFENVMRGAKGRFRTHCKHGHPVTPENVYVRKDTGHRMCRPCKAESTRKRRTKGKVEA